MGNCLVGKGGTSSDRTTGKNGIAEILARQVLDIAYAVARSPERRLLQLRGLTTLLGGQIAPLVGLGTQLVAQGVTLAALLLALLVAGRLFLRLLAHTAFGILRH